MAGRGPAPKGERSRDRDTPVFDELELPAEGILFGFPLPDGVLGGESWHPQTVAWWESLRAFPLLKDEPAIGWQFLLDTALMHHTMWSKGKWEFASEVRLRVAKFGATPEDRMRLKVKITTPAPRADASGVTDLASRRGRLTG